jgi:hypothetical protein
MGRWETHRGDEWWYTDDAIEAGGSPNMASAPPVFQIRACSRTPGGLNEDSLLRLLRLTREQLPGLSFGVRSTARRLRCWRNLRRKTALGGS